MAAPVAVEEGREAAAGVNPGDAPPVDGAGTRHQARRAPVAQEGVIRNLRRAVHHPMTVQYAAGTPGSGSGSGGSGGGGAGGRGRTAAVRRRGPVGLPGRQRIRIDACSSEHGGQAAGGGKRPERAPVDGLAAFGRAHDHTGLPGTTAH